MPPHNFTGEEMTYLLGDISEAGEKPSAGNLQAAEKIKAEIPETEGMPAQAETEEAG